MGIWEAELVGAMHIGALEAGGPVKGRFQTIRVQGEKKYIFRGAGGG